MRELETCYNCDKDFEFDTDDAIESVDIVDGEHVVFWSVSCPHCEAETRW